MKSVEPITSASLFDADGSRWVPFEDHVNLSERMRSAEAQVAELAAENEKWRHRVMELVTQVAELTEAGRNALGWMQLQNDWNAGYWGSDPGGDEAVENLREALREAED